MDLYVQEVDDSDSVPFLVTQKNQGQWLILLDAHFLKNRICTINDLQLFWQRFYACMYVLPKFLRPPSSLCKYAHMHIYEYLWSKFVFIIAISRYLAPRQPTGALFSNYRLHSTGNGKNLAQFYSFWNASASSKAEMQIQLRCGVLEKNWQVREQLKAIHL